MDYCNPNDINIYIFYIINICNYLFSAQISLITGTLEQSLHLVTCTKHPLSSIFTSTTLSHLEQTDEIVNPHFLQLNFCVCM